MGSQLHIVGRNGQVLPSEAILQLKDAVKCEVLFKGEASEENYLAAIDRFNKAAIQEAAIIMFCESDEDVSACLQYVQKWDLEMVISCGRHSYYGASSTHGLVIDLRKMKKVSIDKEAMTVTAGGGCQAIDLETPLQAEGLSVVMGAANDTGIGGLTLGGGSGFLSGQYGLVIDNLLAARVVLADGSVVQASEKSNTDLFWGLRGGGSNFGVVTEFTYRVHNQGPVFFGPMLFTPDKTKPFLELTHTLKNTVDSADGKLAIFIAWAKIPAMPAVHPFCLVFYDGPEDEARKLLEPLYALGPVAAMATMKTYAECTMPSPEIIGPLTHQRYATSNAQMFNPLDTDIVQGLVDDLAVFFDKYGDAIGPSKVALEFRHHAKSSSVPVTGTALASRAPDQVWTVIEAQYDASVSDAVMRAEVKTMSDKIKDSLRKKYPDRGAFFNANIASGTEKVSDMFGENLPKLRELKRKYDPNFVFNKWYPIPPAEA